MIFNSVLMGQNTSDATALPDEIFKDKTAYIQSGKVTGTFSIDQELAEQKSEIEAIQSLLTIKTVPVAKEEQEKTIAFNKNGTVTVLPDADKVLNKVIVTIDIPIAASFIDDTTTDLVYNGATRIKNGLFANHPFLKTVSLPNVTEIGHSAFANDKVLETVSIPAATTIGVESFAYNGILETVSAEKLTTMGTGAFSYDNNLQSAMFPLLQAVPESGFYRCHSLTACDFSSVKDTYYRSFYHNDVLTKIKFPSLTRIHGEQCFYKCDALEAIILSNSAVCILDNSNSLTRTKIAAGTGFIYVPKALVDQYKADPQWSVYAAQFRAIEDYPDICG